VSREALLRYLEAIRDVFQDDVARHPVTFNDGATFGKPGTAHARLNFGTPHPHLAEVLEVMQTAQAAR
jgi:bifunctional pyridoxal-dependent enzyme with beta-cystathionase and maltose regulon repressor activities